MIDWKKNIIPNRQDGKDRSRILPVPYFVGVLRIVQAALTFLTMLLAAISAGIYRNYISPGQAFTCFCFAWVGLYFAYLLLTAYLWPDLYHYWAQLPLECLTVLFWLVAFALMADETAVITRDGQITSGGLTTSNFAPVPLSLHKAAAGLGSLTFLAFIATLILLSIEIHKILQAKRGSSSTTTVTTTEVQGGVEMATQPGVAQQKILQPVVNQQQFEQPLLSHQYQPHPYPQQSYPAPQQYTYQDAPQQQVFSPEQPQSHQVQPNSQAQH